jgi:prepilin-type N-terminal cleavage/methylation domain-containing protein
MMMSRTGKNNMKRGQRGFTLLEIMLAIGILMLLVGVVTLSLREKWERDQTKRSAQRILLVFMKAQSRAIREGREWLVVWDKNAAQFKAMPAVNFQQDQEGVQPAESVPDLSFDFGIDKTVKVTTEKEEEGAPTSHFYGNGRGRSPSLLVTGVKKDVWRIRLDYLGRPVLEFVSAPGQVGTVKKREGPLPTIESSKTTSTPASE